MNHTSKTILLSTILLLGFAIIAGSAHAVPIACNAPSDCGTSTVCVQYTCIANVCGQNYASSSTTCAAPTSCRAASMCNGAGACNPGAPATDGTSCGTLAICTTGTCGPDYATILNTIHTDLLSQGINNNIDTCAATPSSCTGLYFEKPGVGKITFPGTLDLTNANTITTLQALGSGGISFTNGQIVFNATAGDAFKTLGGRLEMYGLTFGFAPTIYINGVAVTGSDVNSILYDNTTGNLTFTALHFSTFMVDTIPPVIAAHADVYADATSAAGATVTYTAPDATDNVDATAPATCTPAPGLAFPMGNTTITCTKTDAAGNVATPTTFKVIVRDITAPHMSGTYPTSVITTTNPIIEANFTDAVGFNATDVVENFRTGQFAGVYVTQLNNGPQNNVAINSSCVTLDGTGTLLTYSCPSSLTQDGNYTIFFGTKDITGNQMSDQWHFVIDTLPPTSTANATNYTFGTWTNQNVDVLFACQDAGAGCEVTPNNNTYPYHCIDTTNTCTPDTATHDLLISGEGTWYVRYFSRDAAGNTETVQSVVVMIDKTAPVLDLHENIIANATMLAGAVVTYTAPNATDNVNGTFAATCTPASGSIFAYGTNVVTCTATDSAGNSATNNFTVSVSGICGAGYTATCACGDLIGGSYTLTQNLSCTGNGLRVVSNNVTLDCAGHAINGLGWATGVNISNVNDTTVKSCTIRAFGTGVLVSNSQGNLFTNNNIENNGLPNTGMHFENVLTTLVSGGIFKYNDLGAKLVHSTVNFTNNDFTNNTGYGLYVDWSSTAHLVNNNFLYNGVNTLQNYGVYDLQPTYIRWRVNNPITCTGNDIYGTGWILPTGGNINHETNCTIQLVREFSWGRPITFTPAQQGYKEYQATVTRDQTSVSVGGAEDFFQATFYDGSGGFCGNPQMSLSVYNQNPTEIANSGLGVKWVQLSNNIECLDNYTIRVYYTPAELAVQNLNENTLVIEYLGNGWENLTTTVNTAEHYVEANVGTRTGYFGIYGNKIVPAPTQTGGGRNFDGGGRDGSGGGISCATGFHWSYKDFSCVKDESPKPPQQPPSETGGSNTQNNNPPAAQERGGSGGNGVASGNTPQTPPSQQGTNKPTGENTLTGAVTGGGSSSLFWLWLLLAAIAAIGVTGYVVRKLRK